MQRLKEIFFFVLFICFYSSCAKDKLEVQEGECFEEITYVQQIKLIIDRSCAYTACHDGSGTAPGNFRIYSGLSPFLNQGKFETRAVNQRDMPPVYATDAPPLALNEIQMLRCWIENNYQEQ